MALSVSLLCLSGRPTPFAANSVPCAKDGKIGVLGKPQRALVAVTNKDGKVGVLGRPQRALVAHPFTLLPPSPFVGARGRSTSSLPSDHQESPAEDDDNEQTAKTSSSLQDVGEQDKISKIGAGAGDVNKIGTGAGGEGARRVDGAADYKIKDVVAAVNSNKSASHTADNTSGDDRTTDGPGARRRRHRRRRPQPHDDMLLRRILSYSSSMSRKLDDLRSLPRDVAVDMKKTRSKIASLRWIIPLTTGISLFVGGSLTFILTIKFGIPFVVGKFIEESSKVLESIDAK
uniref:Uncharacterized protein n=1 Tax=Oryza brachyantha TaxID=4533 RepID=J3MII9_ORYBR